MSLPNLDGRAFMISKDGVQLKTTENGQKMARFAVAFNKSTKNSHGEYEKKAEFVAQCVAFDDLAEFAAQQLSFKDTFRLTGEVELQNWTDKNGNDRTTAQILVSSLSGPIRQPDNSDRPARNSNSRTARERASRSWGSGSNEWGDI